MYSYSKFTKQVLLLSTVNLLGVIQSIVFLPIITKILGVEDYGVWTQLKITLGLLVPFTFLGMNDALIRFLPAVKDKKDEQEGIYSSLVLVCGVTLVFAFLLAIFSEPVSLFLKFNQVFVRLLALIIIFESLSTTLFIIIQARREIGRYFIFVALKMFGETGLVIGAVLLGYGLYGAVLAFLFIRIVIFLVLLAYIIKVVNVRIPNFSLIKEYLFFGLPTMASGIAYWVVTSVDRYIIGFSLGILFVGYYAPAYSIGMLLLFFILPISSMLSVVLPKFFAENNITAVKNYLSRSLKYYFLVMIPSVFGISVLAKPLLSILSTEEIAKNAYFVIPFIAASMLFYGTAVLISHILLLVKKTKLIAKIWIVVAVINFSLNMIFIFKFGIIAAAIVTFISYLCAVILMWYFANKEFIFKIDFNFIIKSVAASILMSFLAGWINPLGLVNILWTVILGVFVYGFLILLFNGVGRKEIDFLKSIINPEKNISI